MKFCCFLLTALLLGQFSLIPASAQARAVESTATARSLSLTPIDTLEKMARNKTRDTARSPMVDDASEKLKGVNFADPLESNHVPNYIRAIAAQSDAAPQFAQLLRTFLYGGSVAPEIKMAMALRIAQVLDSPYAAAHARRWLRASDRGQQLLSVMRTDKRSELSPGDQLAISYAELLTRGVHEVSDPEFQRVSAAYNDSQVVELTMTVCLFNYFTRMGEALNLPVEPWVLDEVTPTPSSVHKYEPNPARVALITDDEMSATAATLTAAKTPQGPAAGLGLGIANSQRAMLRVPALALAWREYGNAARQHASINREIQLHVSFAVSMANGCRYCTLHQVLGLRRLGVSPTKLLAMKKDDSTLSPRELTAVIFARKLTTSPASITDDDYGKVKTEFGEQGAFDVMLQTCAFSFMNRFTDGLRLPSEDEAVRVYREVYGSTWQ